MSGQREHLSFDQVRHRSASVRHWQSLDQLADPEAFRARLEDEFPALAPLLTGTSRREVMRVMGASMALAGLSACDYGPPREKALPWVRAPEFSVPGDPRYYASALPFAGYGLPVLVETHEGRPIKVEGNPEHPVSRGRTDLFAQASVLSLYDPERSGATTYLGRITSFDAFEVALLERAALLAAGQGRGLALLTGAITSPTTVRLIERLQEPFPELSWYVHEPVGRARLHEATRRAGGRVLDRHLHLAQARVILCLDDDPLGPGPAQVPHAMAWIEGRRTMLERQGEVPELIVLESTPTLTGAKASEAWPAGSAEIHNFTLALAQAFGLGGSEAVELPLHLRAALQATVSKLQAAGDRALVSAGPHLPPDLQALTFAINGRLGALGRTMTFTEPVEARPELDEHALPALAQAMDAGAVDTLIILDSNPAYTAPADLEIARAFDQVPFRVHMGAYQDETAALCHWHVPLAHAYETWSDVRAVDGTASVIQPLIRPISGGRSSHRLLATLAGAPARSDYEAVRATWRHVLRGRGDFEAAWREVVHDGFAEGTEARQRQLQIGPLQAPDPKPLPALEAVVRPDPTIWDGRFAANAWLQEMPKPLTKLVWDNAVLISAALAEERQLRNGDLVDLSGGARRLRAAVWILPGQAERTLTLHLGYGRERGAGIATGASYDAYRLRTTEAPWVIEDIVLQAAGAEGTLVSTQDVRSMLGHELVRQVTTGELRAGEAVEHHEGERPSLYPEWEYESYAWAMAIDLDACIGCNACAVACQAENNVPVVGREQVAMGREMHWLRIDRYYSGEIDHPHTHFQPIPCMHCEKAPCEVGCPVNATVHGPEGLNQMIYNRCVGTRTCASYCPYKVRRFNFYDYSEDEPPLRFARRNPDVTVRARGVMEKCTYCVQRISAARIEARKEDRPIPDGEVMTACQQVCPTGAIVFGDQSDPDTLVSTAKRGLRNYTLLGELNTRPRTTYLAEIAREPHAAGHRLHGRNEEG